MKFKIVHDTPGRIRLRCGGYYFDKNQEKSLEKTILSEQYVESVKAKSVNGGILITYQSDYRQELLNYIKGIKRNQFLEEYCRILYELQWLTLRHSHM